MINVVFTVNKIQIYIYEYLGVDYCEAILF